MIIVYKSYMKEGKYVKLFISWSGEAGLKIADVIKTFLEKTTPVGELKTIYFSKDFDGGEQSSRKIFGDISRCDKLIMCITNESKKSPWMMFEAGYAKGLGKKVIPIYFEQNEDYHSWKDNPLFEITPILYERGNFKTRLFNDVKISDLKENHAFYTEMKKSIEYILESEKKIDTLCEELVSELTKKSTFSAMSPQYKDKIAYFKFGFETHDLYKLIFKLYKKKSDYLWIYGRRNSKILDDDYRRYYQELRDEPLSNSECLHDFRCLFLDPLSKNVDSAYYNDSLFEKRLILNIEETIQLVGNSKRLKKCFKIYSHERNDVIIRINDALIVATPDSINGRLQTITNMEFKVLSVHSQEGAHYVDIFNKVWNNAKPLIDSEVY